jgi:hypothetical protein
MHPVRNRFARALLIALAVVVGIAVFGFIVMTLWNWLIPPIVGWKPIDYWQALGLFVLAKILFGFGHGRRHGGMHWKARMLTRWERMTPEEREKFREGLRGWCGEGKERRPREGDAA